MSKIFISHQRINKFKGVDLRGKYHLSILEQGLFNSCIACALSTVVQYLYESNSLFFDVEEEQNSQASIMFIYYHMRLIEMKLPENVPLTVDESVRALIENGVCAESLWPYPQTIDSKRFKVLIEQGDSQAIEHEVALGIKANQKSLTNVLATKPTVNAQRQAQRHCHFSAKSLSIENGLGELIHCLNSGSPFIFGLEQHPSFFVIPKSGMLSIPPINDDRLGGHVVVCLGYDEENQVLICQNSYGQYYGDHGYLYVPYEFILGYFQDNNGIEIANTFSFWRIDLCR